MSTRYDIVEGATEPLDIALRNDGLPIDGTGLTLGLVIEKKGDDTAIDPAPTAAWLDQEAGTVRVSRTDRLAAGVYFARFSLTGSTVGYCPNSEKPDIWKVAPVANP